MPADNSDEGQKQARARQREKELSFLAVFGPLPPGTRTDAQEVVWAALEATCFRHRSLIPASVPSSPEGPSGPIDPVRIGINASKHSLFIEIENLIIAGMTPDNPGNFPVVHAVRK
jgi:hypothetical protein